LSSGRDAADESDKGLLVHLAEEFGEHGARAVEFLETATVLLSGGLTAPRVAEATSYCIREALKEIPQAAEMTSRQNWHSASRAVVEARRRYEIGKSLPGEDPAASLDELLRVIDDLDIVHSQERIHQQRLVAVMAARTGTSPIPAGPVEAYQRLVERLDKSLHSATTIENAQSMYEEALRLMRQLFMPPELRLPELADLAALPSPTENDASRLIALVATDRHLEYFFGRIISADWLALLDSSGLLKPPDGQARWPVFRLVERLKEAAAEPVARWLTKAFERWGAASPISAWFIARAALDIGGAGNEVVLGALRSHPSSPQIQSLAMSLVEAVDPQDQLVVDVADLLFNPSGGLDRSFEFEEISKVIQTGVTAGNWTVRVELLIQKIRAIEDDDHFLQMLEFQRAGSIADRPEVYDDDRSAALLGALIEILASSRAAGVPGQDLLAVIGTLRTELLPRVRCWLLSELDDVNLDVLVAEVSDAIRTRRPCGDDAQLIDHILGLGGGEGLDVDKWRAALGALPPPEEVGMALAEGSLEGSWIRAREWSALLPEDVSNDWSKALVILEGAIGPFTRESLASRRPVEMGVGTSPVSEEDLEKIPANEAARWIARWRPGPNSWLVGSRELARTLEAVVKRSPAPWIEAPLEIVALLHEPIYISHYFRGLAEADTLDSGRAAEITEAVAFVRTHPWPPTPMGRNDWDWDPTWANADGDGVSLLRRFAEKDIGFGDRSEQAWGITLAAATTTDGTGTYEDALTAAISRHQTSAVEAVFALLGWKYRQGTEVRQEALDLFDNALRIHGRDGEQHRAIIVPRLPFLIYIAPKWVDERTDLIFGDEAPDGLGQPSIDLYVRWGRPNRWIFERVRDGLIDAVGRSIDNAMASLLIAMLWRIHGYSVDEIVELIAGSGDEFLSRAGETLSRLLRHGDVDPDHLAIAVAFFQAVLLLERPPALYGFGWFAELGDLDEDTWLGLTVAAARLAHGRLDWGHKVADRAAASDSERGLEILNYLVRGLADEWDKGHVMEKSLASLRRAGSLRETETFRRLRTSLLERGVFDAEDL